MAFDKLAICNNALLRTGNNPVAEGGDGSDEWISASDAYDSFLPICLGDHNWGFQRGIVELTRTGDSSHPDFDDRYAKPAQCLHVLNVWVDDVPAPFKIVDNEVNVNGSGYTVKAQYVKEPADETRWPPKFIEALRLFIMSAILSGLNEDATGAAATYKAAEQMLADARNRSDQEGSVRVYTRSRLVAARRTRKISTYVIDPWLRS